MLYTKEITYRRCNHDEPRDARLGQGKIILRNRDFRGIRRHIISSQKRSAVKGATLLSAKWRRRYSPLKSERGSPTRRM
jgi:hypothetical protein